MRQGLHPEGPPGQAHGRAHAQGGAAKAEDGPAAAGREACREEDQVGGAVRGRRRDAGRDRGGGRGQLHVHDDYHVMIGRKERERF